MRELLTERLRLRYITEADTRRIFDCWASDPEVTKFLTWDVHTNLGQTEGYMNYVLSEYKKEDAYRWGIELKETGELIGMIDVVGYEDGAPAVGYCSGRAYWGNGYMTEALKAVTAALFEDGFDTVKICAADENTGSNRVIQKCGFDYTESKVEPISQMKPGTVLKINYYEKHKPE